MILNELHVAASFLLAMISCLLYISVRRKRRSRIVWGFMVIPCLEMIALELWFYFGEVPLLERVVLARIALVALALQISAIALSLAWRDWRNGK